jgi:hypothetical protein
MNTRRDVRLGQYFSLPQSVILGERGCLCRCNGKKVQKSLDGMDRRIWGYEALPGGG